MKALDTNVLIRFLVADDEKQACIVRDLFKQAEAKRDVLFVPLPVTLEMIWVLESVYDISRQDILDALQKLLLMPVLSFDAQEALQHLIQSAQRGSEDLADLLIAHAAIQSGCSTVLTFDRKASKFMHFQLLA